MRFIISLAAATTVLAVPAVQAQSNVQVLRSGKPISELYRAKFAECDRSDSFDEVRFPIKNKAGQTIWYRCSTDPSRFDRFETIEKSNASPEAVVIVSKLGHDNDGSNGACHGKKGPTDQCTTSLMLKPTPSHPCEVKVSPGFPCVPIDPDAIAYVVMPGFAPKGIDATAFHKLSGLSIGDYGVAIANGNTVPVIIADAGPAYKIGEGSGALLRALSGGRESKTLGSGVTFVMFPGSRDAPSVLSPDTLSGIINTKGIALYNELMNNN